MAKLIVPADAEGPLLVCTAGLSFWGGVDPATGTIIDAHHPHCGACLAGQIVMMPTSRGSCSGSGVLLELAMNGHAPAGLVFREGEDVLTLGALIAAEMFGHNVAVLRLPPKEYAALASETHGLLRDGRLRAGALDLHLDPVGEKALDLSASDEAMLAGERGEAVALAMRVLCRMAAAQGAAHLTDVTRAHIDGCIYHSPANLIFAERMAAMGARVSIPTTINAISVDLENWRDQGMAEDFGAAASRLAGAYVEMGAQPSFTCAPYLADHPPEQGEALGWSESNAVIFANSVLGARSAKHPDYLDLFIALTGRAPLAGVYLSQNRIAQVVIEVERPTGHDESIWPMIGWLAGQAAPGQIPLLRRLTKAKPGRDDLKAFCAAFGTTSAAPMLHIEGVTPEGDIAPAPDAPTVRIARSDVQRAWRAFNTGPETVDLVALGSPHLSLEEARNFADALGGRKVKANTIITLGRETREAAQRNGLLDRLTASGVTLVSDLCWCSMTEPVFPPAARTLMTNSGKYAHYAPGLSERAVRFGSMADCAEAAVTGRAAAPPGWLFGPA